MNPDLFAAWLDALTSGRYPMGRDVARSDRGWTCFGVLMNLIDPKAWVQDRYGFWRWHGNTIGLPDWLKEQTGLTARCCYWIAATEVNYCDTFTELAESLPYLVRLDACAERWPSPGGTGKPEIHRVIPMPKLGRRPKKNKGA